MKLARENNENIHTRMHMFGANERMSAECVERAGMQIDLNRCPKKNGGLAGRRLD